MRIIYILLAGICLCLSTVFVFSGFSIRSDISDARENLEKQRQIEQQAQEKIDGLTETYNGKKSQIESLKTQLYYSTAG